MRWSCVDHLVLHITLLGHLRRGLLLFGNKFHSTEAELSRLGFQHAQILKLVILVDPPDSTIMSMIAIRTCNLKDIWLSVYFLISFWRIRCFKISNFACLSCKCAMIHEKLTLLEVLAPAHGRDASSRQNHQFTVHAQRHESNLFRVSMACYKLG